MTPGRLLILAGVVLASVGILIELAPALRLGRLPGDVSFGGQNWRVYVSVGTSILLSIVLSIIFGLFSYFGSRK